ncbi:phage tail tape measure protein [Lysobacter sp. LF1]|uniref:Phage tail tape measure protein n=1 Tax=Lysobacter stagni TaxID=3045172 RepID=A0ABT6XKN6_9GAMM|nr:phage tail tape measure protein [Lysobacter sp. LF1]MDI9240735.1 phage tail tape measure protein [Lysobacter sp. LF1]
MAGKRFDLSVVIRGIDNITGTVGRIQRSIAGFHNQVTARFRGFGQRMGFGELTRAAGGVKTALGGLVARLTMVGGAIAALATTAGATAYSLLQSFADAAGAVNDVSRSIDINAETLQEWRFGAKQTGVETEAFDKALQTLTRNLGQAAKGKGPADLLKALGISLKTTSGRLKTAEQIFPQFADKMQAIRDPTLRAAAAAELFGKAGVRLLPLMMEGSEGLARYAAEARRLNLVISTDSISAADDFGDKLDSLKGAFTGLRNVAGSALMPVMTKLIEQLTDFVSKHGDEIRGFFERLGDELEKLPDRIEEIRAEFDKLRAKVKPLTDFVEGLCAEFGTANVILAITAAVISTVVVTAIAQLTLSVYALGVAILTTPLGWILAALLLIGVAAYKLYKNWDLITSGFEAWWETVKGIFGVAGDFLSGIWDDITAGFKGGFLEGLIGLWKTLNPVALITRAFTELLPNLKRAIEPAIRWVTDKLDRLLPDWAQALIGGIPSSAGKTVGAGGGAKGLGAGARLGPPVGAEAVGERSAAVRDSLARVQVDFTRMPTGTRVSSETRGPMEFELNQGYARSF